MTFRQELFDVHDIIYQTLGHSVQYHSVTGIITDIIAIERVDAEFGPEGFLSTIQETETIYFVRKIELLRPEQGALIIDEDKRFEIIRPETRNRYEWILITREMISENGDC